MKLLTYNDSDYDNINALDFTINFGKNIVREYLVSEFKKSNENLSFSLWKDKKIFIVSPFEYNNKLFDFLSYFSLNLNGRMYFNENTFTYHWVLVLFQSKSMKPRSFISVH